MENKKRTMHDEEIRNHPLFWPAFCLCTGILIVFCGVFAGLFVFCLNWVSETFSNPLLLLPAVSIVCAVFLSPLITIWIILEHDKHD